ncbi:hypothetical protein Agub_g6908 [Astrephomene gubernaculifera]|uniref:3'-5' exonuclease domain-containing protein n=1 Tax=Astrephomene gubernaculifera TaxID=47775 RepID=A0AAD3HM05_9CHLO|nr:hypothetical protein Agub_g6908 [Astrephomene gubernaculifera]
MALILLLASRGVKQTTYRGACSLPAYWSSLSLLQSGKEPALDTCGLNPLTASVVRRSSSSSLGLDQFTSLTNVMTTLRPSALPSGRKRQATPSSPSSGASDIQDIAGDSQLPSCRQHSDLETTTSFQRRPHEHQDQAKSAKRRAAEALLAVRFGGPSAPYLPHVPSQQSLSSGTCKASAATAAPAACGCCGPRSSSGQVRGVCGGASCASDDSSARLPGCCRRSSSPEEGSLGPSRAAGSGISGGGGKGGKGVGDSGASSSHALGLPTSRPQPPSSSSPTLATLAKGMSTTTTTATTNSATPNPNQQKQQQQQPKHSSPRQFHNSHHHSPHEPPPAKRARLALAAATSLGKPPAAAAAAAAAAAIGGTGTTTTAAVGGTAAAAAAGPKQPPPRPPPITVPACDPARGCKERLLQGQEHAAALTGAEAAAKAAARAAAAPKTNGATTAAAVTATAAGAATAVVGVASSGQGGATVAAAAAASAATAATATAATGPVWCSFDVKVPSGIRWQAVFGEPPSALQRFSMARGYEKLILPEGLVSYVVENPRRVEDALQRLRASMQDRVIAIDLEWKPEVVAGRTSPVALLQLATASTCLLLRVSCMGFSLPTPVAEFLADPSLVILGFGWDTADEAKMAGTFGMGRARFHSFLDLQQVAADLGYHSYGLARLAEQVLGLPMNKAKSVSRSNWAAPSLNNHQLKYASLDVFTAGQLFRALRLWHSSPSPCAACRNPIGELLQLGPLHCGEPSCNARPATDLMRYINHCTSRGHPPRYGTCSSCGRIHEFAAAAAARQQQKQQMQQQDGEKGKGGADKDSK